MEEEVKLYTIILRHDSSTNWTINNPVLSLGEYGVEDDTHRVKRGDGTTPWEELLYEHFGLEYLVTFGNLLGEVTDNENLSTALNAKISKEIFADTQNSLISGINISSEDGTLLGKITKSTKNVNNNALIRNYLEIKSSDNSIQGLWTVDTLGVRTLDLKSDLTIPNWEVDHKYYINHVIYYNRRLYRCLETHMSTATFDNTKFQIITSLFATDIIYDNSLSGLDSTDVKNAIDEVKEITDTKLTKTSRASKVYGTDAQGEQVLYDKDSLRTVDTVNHVAADANKNIQIDSTKINYDDSVEVKKTIKEILDSKVDKTVAGVGEKIVKDVVLNYNTATGQIELKEEKLSLEDGAIASETTTVDVVSEAELAGAVANLNTRINTEVTTLNTRISTEVTNLNNRIDTEVSNINNTFNSVNANINTVNIEIHNRINTEVTNINNRIDTEVSNINNTFNVVNTNINTMNSEIHNRINTEVTNLNGRIDATDLNVTNLANLENNHYTEIHNRINTEVSNINSRINTEVETLNNAITTNIANVNNAIIENVTNLNNTINTKVENLSNFMNTTTNTMNTATANEFTNAYNTINTLNTTMHADLNTGLNTKIDKSINDSIVVNISVDTANDSSGDPTLKITSKNTDTKTDVVKHIHFQAIGDINLNSENDHIQVDSTDIDQKISQNTTRITTHTTEINTLKTRMTTAENNIVALETENAAQEAHLTRLDQKDTAQDTQIQNNANAITQTNENVATLDSNKANKTFAQTVGNKIVGKAKLGELTGSEIIHIDKDMISPVDGTKTTEVISIISSNNTITGTVTKDAELNIINVDLATNLDTDVNYFVTSATLDERIAYSTTIAMSTLTPTGKTTPELQDIVSDAEGTWARVSSIDTANQTVTVVTFHKHAQAVWGTIKGNIDAQQDLALKFSGINTSIADEATARTNADAQKVDKVTTADQIYGTDETGAQTSFNKSIFGVVDKVNNKVAVNKNVQLDGNDINVDDTEATPISLKAMITTLQTSLANLAISYNNLVKTSEYIQGNTYRAGDFVFVDNSYICYMGRVIQNFTADTTGATALASFIIDVEADNIKRVGIPAEEVEAIRMLAKLKINGTYTLDFKDVLDNPIFYKTEAELTEEESIEIMTTFLSLPIINEDLINSGIINTGDVIVTGTDGSSYGIYIYQCTDAAAQNFILYVFNSGFHKRVYEELAPGWYKIIITEGEEGTPELISDMPIITVVPKDIRKLNNAAEAYEFKDDVESSASSWAFNEVIETQAPQYKLDTVKVGGTYKFIFRNVSLNPLAYRTDLSENEITTLTSRYMSIPTMMHGDLTEVTPGNAIIIPTDGSTTSLRATYTYSASNTKNTEFIDAYRLAATGLDTAGWYSVDFDHQEYDGVTSAAQITFKVDTMVDSNNGTPVAEFDPTTYNDIFLSVEEISAPEVNG